MDRCSLSGSMLLAAGAWLAATLPAGAADVVFAESFDSPTPTWRVAAAAHVRPLSQDRIRGSEGNAQATAERLSLACPAGYAAQLEHDVGTLPAIDELTCELVVRANRPGVQFAARVIFPRSVDPQTGEPRRTLVSGTRYSDPGRWQRLRLDKVPKLAERHARLMSVSPSQQVDSRQAYVDRVVLIVPGGSGASVVEIDELTIEGVAGSAPGNQPSTLIGGSDFEGPLLQAPGNMASGQQETFEPVDVRRRGDTLFVAGVPLVPRVLQARGEPMDAVAELGFNAVLLSEIPTEAQLRAARDARLWIICPPPSAERLSEIERNSIWQTVLAWSLGLDCGAVDLDHVASNIDELRRSDPLGRPILVGAGTATRRFSRLADILVRRRPLPLDGDNAPPAPPDLPLLGCSPWTQFSLGWSDEAKQQLQRLAPRAGNLGWHQAYADRHAMLDAMAAGARGLVVLTPERIGRSSPEARRVADQLQLVNRELALIEPWHATGNRIDGAELTGTPVRTTAWQLGQTRLVYLPRQSASETMHQQSATLLIAGTSETAKAHLLNPGGLAPLNSQRVSGGCRLQLDGTAAGALVVLTDDARALAQVQRRIGRNGADAALAERGLAVAEVTELEAILSQLVHPGDQRLRARLAALKEGVQRCDQLQAAGSPAQVVQLARQLRQGVAQERDLLQRQLAAPGFSSIPTRFEPRLLPTHQALRQSLDGLPRGSNLLPGGDFEDLATTQNAGWVQANFAGTPLETSVEFTPASPRQGQASLRLAARATDDLMTSADDEKPPVVWINSPDVKVAAGSIVEISGWVRVAMLLGDQRGDLVIRDTLGGDELAIRIPATTGWQPFRMIRAAGATTSLRLSLALTGAATAEVDGVMIREVVYPRRTATTAAKLPSR